MCAFAVIPGYHQQMMSLVGQGNLTPATGGGCLRKAGRHERCRSAAVASRQGPVSPPAGQT
jgi:hypothetical protein